MERKRETELDILRIIAMLAVITVHCTGMGTDSIAVENGGKQFLIFIDSIITWQVPVFVMISGRFFLDPEREIPAKKIAKSVLRLVIAFVVWDIVYQVYYIMSGTYVNLNWKGILSQAIVGPYHFWYLHMLIWVYMITPFLRKITQSKRLMEYFILLFMVFEFLTNYGVILPLIGDTVAAVLVKTNFHFALGYAGYYILGYYLHKYRLSKNKEIALYALALVLLIGAGVATVNRSLAEGANEEWYTQYLMPNIIIEAAAVYTFFVKRIKKLRLPEKAVKLISKLSEYSFGVYLVHALVADLLALTGLSVMTINPVFMLPCIIIIVFILSNLLVFSLRSIPVIGKKIT